VEQRHDGDERGDLPRSAVIARTTSFVIARAGVVTQAERGQSGKGEIYRSFGNGYTRAFELAVTPAILGLFGYWLDKRLGILPVLTIVLALVAFVTLLAQTWYGYVQQMEALERAGPWATSPEPPVVAAPPPVPAPAPEAAT
jgi:hypothetical protein